MCAPRGVMGRWINAQYPLILRRQESRILVVWRHDDAESLKGPEILCESQRHSGATPRV